MICHKICYNVKMLKIISKLSLLPLLIWSTELYRDAKSYNYLWPEYKLPQNYHHTTVVSSDVLLQSTLDISNTDISKYPLISKNIVWITFLYLFIFQIILSQISDISK